MATTTSLEPSWQLTAIEHAAATISDLARNNDLAAPVPHLARWKVRDVVAHLGGVHRWATRIVQERSMSGPGFKKSKLDGMALCDWFDDGVQLLLGTLKDTGLDEPCPNFNPGSERVVRWWARRQAHETIVHRWDVEHSLGPASQIPNEIAVDGIDEFLDVFVRTRGKQTLSSSLLLRTTRPARSWMLTPATKPGRIDVATEFDTPSTATQASGKPSALLLALWGRRSATQAGLTINGDPDAAASLFTI